MVLSLQFTAFDIAYDYAYDHPSSAWDTDYKMCTQDFLTIIDGDGTVLIDKSCGSSSTEIVYYDLDSSDPSSPEYWSSMGSGLPPNITSTSNVIKFLFEANLPNVDDYEGGGGSKSGWSVSWSAVTP